MSDRTVAIDILSEDDEFRLSAAIDAFVELYAAAVRDASETIELMVRTSVVPSGHKQKSLVFADREAAEAFRAHWTSGHIPLATS
jgi:hypothetical protein